MGNRHASTPDVPRIDNGVTLFRSCLLSAEYPGCDVVREVRTIFEATGFKERLAAVRGETPSGEGH